MPKKPATTGRPRTQPAGKDPSPPSRSPSRAELEERVRYAKSLWLSKDQMPGSGERRSVRG